MEQISPRMQCINRFCHGRTNLTILKLLVERIALTKLLQDRFKSSFAVLPRPKRPVGLPRITATTNQPMNFGPSLTNHQRRWPVSESQQDNSSSPPNEHTGTKEVRRNIPLGKRHEWWSTLDIMGNEHNFFLIAVEYS